MSVSSILNPTRRGRQRSEVADQAILAATLDILATDGYGGLTMAAVIAARRSPRPPCIGAGPPTAPRRRRSRVVAQRDRRCRHRSLEGDIAALLTSIADAISVQKDDIGEEVAVELRCNPDFRAAVNEKFLLSRIAILEAVLTRARDRNELGPGLNPKVAYSLVSGPMPSRLRTLRNSHSRLPPHHRYRRRRRVESSRSPDLRPKG